MTREMNKPDWHNEWVCISLQNGYGEFIKIEPPKQRKLDDWIKPYIDSINERFKQ